MKYIAMRTFDDNDEEEGLSRSMIGSGRESKQEEGQSGFRSEEDASVRERQRRTEARYRSHGELAPSGRRRAQRRSSLGTSSAANAQFPTATAASGTRRTSGYRNIAAELHERRARFERASLLLQTPAKKKSFRTSGVSTLDSRLLDLEKDQDSWEPPQRREHSQSSSEEGAERGSKQRMKRRNSLGSITSEDRNFLMAVGGTRNSRATRQSFSDRNLLLQQEEPLTYSAEDRIELEDAMIEHEENQNAIFGDSAISSAKDKCPYDLSEVNKYLWEDNEAEQEKIRAAKRQKEMQELTRLLLNGITAFSLCVFILASSVTVGGWKPFPAHADSAPAEMMAQRNSNENENPLEMHTKEKIIDLILPISPTVSVIDSPQRMALDWLLRQQLPHSSQAITQLYVLAAFYYSTDGEEWTANNWLEDANECNWKGVICKDQQPFAAITALQLEQKNLKGTIPIEIGHLPFLEDLHISNNHLHGKIPTSISQLKHLTKLHLNNNNLDGPIPKGIGAMTSLQSIDLSHNKITGGIPVDLKSLQKLESLVLNDNQLQGKIPDDIPKLESLQILSLSRNELFGPISSEIGQLQQLEILHLSENAFTGSLPPALGHLTSLRVLDASKNGLKGPIPKSFKGLKHLEYLHLDHNELEGNVPNWMGKLNSLVEVTLEENSLEGTVSQNVCDLKLKLILTDCGGDPPRVACDCCTTCSDSETTATDKE